MKKMKKMKFNSKTALIMLLVAFSISSCKKITKKLETTTIFEDVSLGEKKGNISPIYSKFNICNNEDYTASPVGGGYGFTNLVIKSQCDIIIHSASEFKTWISSFPSLNNPSLVTAWIENSFDLSSVYNANDFPIKLPGNIVIAGNRGQNPYITRITMPDENVKRCFEIRNDNVRITGLAFEGPDPTPDYKLLDESKISICFHIYGKETGVKNIGIDNCEIYGWNNAAISVKQNYIQDINAMPMDIMIHHNYIHHNAGNGFGYGIVVQQAWANIYKNKFETNRHDIASTGHETSGYEAGCNIVLERGAGVNFDVHGESEPGNTDAGPRGGRFFFIHHNEFKDVGRHRFFYEKVDGPPSNQDIFFNIGIRGRPDVQCRIENNIFYNTRIFASNQNPSERTGSIAQYNNTGITNLGYNSMEYRLKYTGNLILLNNIWGRYEYLGRYVVESWDESRNTNTFNIKSSGDTLMQVNKYRFGNFSGSGETEILKIENGKWYKLPIKVGGYTESWEYVNTSNADPEKLKIANFNNTFQSDVFYNGNGSTWQYTSGGQGSWVHLNTSSHSLIRLGRFLNNGNNSLISDVFYSDGNHWYISHNGTSSWSQINTSGANPYYLRLGDFNGDGVSDVFYAGYNTNSWDVSYNGTSSWTHLATSGSNSSDIILADFDYDNSLFGKTDVIADVGGQYKVSLAGTSSWVSLYTTNFPRSTFKYGNLK